MAFFDDLGNQLAVLLGGGPNNNMGSTNNAQWVAAQSPLSNPIDQATARAAFDQSQGAYAGQQALVNALNAQNGIANEQGVLGQQQQLASLLAGANGVGNQSSVFGQSQGLANQLSAANTPANQQAVFGQGMGLANQLAANNGAANQQAVFNQGQALANALALQAQGGGPNPSLAMLQRATGENVANQAALAAGQRGSAGNVGLMARNIGNQGANIQQNAISQAAMMQAQQQLAAQHMLGQQNESLGRLATAQVGQQAGLQNQLAGQAGNQIGQQMTLQQLLGGLAGTQIGQQQHQQGMMGQLAGNQAGRQIGANEALTNAAQGLSGQALGQTNAQNTATNTQLGNINTTNAAMAGINANNAAKATSQVIGGLTNAAGGYMTGGVSGLGKAMMGGAAGGAKGGTVMNGVIVPPVGRNPQYVSKNWPSHLKKIAELYHPQQFAEGGEVFAQNLAQSAQPFEEPKKDEGQDTMAMAMKLAPLLLGSGGQVPGKAKVAGDSPKNDTVPAILSPGEVVIPKSVMESVDPPKAAAQFVASLHKQKGAGKEDYHKDFREALNRAIKGRAKK